MIHVYGAADPPVPRLLAALAARGHATSREAAVAGDDPAATLVLGPGAQLDALALGVLLGAWRRAKHGRVLMLSLIGAHPDAHAPRLKALWELEEQARGAALPVLTLRLAPLLGPVSPLWLRLRSRPRLPDGGRKLLNPVDESDVLETLDRALSGKAPWKGWYEVAGPEALSLAELAELAKAAGPARERGGWEPPLEELREHRLGEHQPWAAHFGLAPGSITARAREWAS